MNRPSLYLLGALLLATQAQAQTLTSVTPASAPAGSPAQTLLVNGRFQQYPVTVYWTFQNTTTTLAVSNFDGFSQFNATVPASLLTTPGVASIYVTELSSGPSNSLSFTITGGLTSISPNFAQAGGPAFTLTANGNGFSQNTIIVWNGTQLPTTFVSPQQLTTTIPASLIVTAGTASVTIAQPGLTSPSPLPFTIYAPPTLTSINPNSALTGSPAITIQLNGSSFTPNTVATWNGSPLVTTYSNSNTLLAAIPSSDFASEGVAQVGIQQNGLTSPPTLPFDVGPPPTLTSISPTSTAAGGPAFTLTLNGSDFIAQTVAYWNGTALPTSFVNSTQLTATVAANLITQPATASITAQTVGRTSNALSFMVTGAQLSLTSISPSSAAAGGPAFTLLANGSNFTSNTSITWNGAAVTTTFVNANQLSANIPASLIATAGSASVDVSMPGVPSPQPLPFTITGGLTLTSLSPSSTSAGSPSFTLTANGTGFNSGTVLYWGSTSLSTTIVNSGQVSANIPANLLTQPTTVSITAANGTLPSNALTFTVTTNALTLTSISPNSVPSGSPSFTLTATGTGFTPNTVVTWNGSSLSTTFVSAVQLNATIPATLVTTPGTASVGVTSPQQTSPPSLTFTITGGLTLTSLSPSSAAAGSSAFGLAVTGTGFNSGTILYWNSTALSTSVSSANQLTANIPANLLTQPGSASITAVNGSLSSNALAFTISNGLTISSVSPSSVQAGGPTFTLTVNGTGFTSNTVVFWSGTALTTSFSTANLVTATVPANLIAQSGAATITAQNGTQTSNAVGVQIGGQTTPPAQPITLISVSPNTAPAGSGNVPITVTGTNFVGPSGTFVTFNGTTLTTTFVSSSQLNAIIPAALLTNPGIAAISVTGQQPQPAYLPFTITNGLTLTSITPNSVAAGGPDFTLTAIGSGFVSTTTVTWNGSRLATTFVSSTQLTATVPASFITAAGTVSIDVSATSPQQPPPALPLVITQGLVLTSLSPTSAIAGGPAFTLTVNGTGFTAGTTVNWNSTPLVTAFVSGTQLTVAVSTALLAQAGTVSITASTGTLVSNALPFAILPPTITSLSPSTAAAGGPAFSLTVSGTNFLPSSTVTWNGAAVATTYVSGTQLTAAITPDLIAKGPTASVVVLNGTAASNTVSFSITVAPPVLTSISPSTANQGGPAFTLTINGTGFVAGATASLGATALSTSFVSATQLTAAVPATLLVRPGPSPVTVSNPGSAASNPLPFTVNPPVPTITGISPTTVTQGGPTFTLTVTGTNFLAGALVFFNSTQLNTTVVSPTQITAQVPAELIAQPGAVQITVTNTNGTPSIAVTLTVTTTAPTLTSINPVSAKVGDPTFTLALTGTNFVQASVAQWNGSPLSTTFVSSTQLTATIDTGRLILPATASVTVVNPGPNGTSLTSNALSFTINPVTPSLSSISPSSTNAGGPAFSLTVNGTGFLSLTTIQWNTTALTTRFVSATQVTADVPANLIAQPGTVTVTAINPGNNVSGPSTFTITAPAPAVISSLSKTSVTAGDAAFTVTITGTGFLSSAVVNFGSTALATTFVSATQLTAAVPANLLMTPNTTVQVTVAQAGTTSNGIAFTVNLPAAPTLRLNPPTGTGAAQQPTIDFGLNSPYPIPLSGTVTLTFASNATVPVDDPSIQFASGGRTFSFSVPANTTTFPALQLSTGTVAGTITLTVTLTAAGVNVTPSSGATATIVIGKTAPVILSGKVKLVHANGYLEVDVTGFSTTRDMTQAVFQLNAAPGGSFTSSTITVPISTIFTTWYQSAASATFGGQFTYTQPFTVIGDTNQVQSVTVTMTNSAGTSISMTSN